MEEEEIVLSDKREAQLEDIPSGGMQKEGSIFLLLVELLHEVATMEQAWEEVAVGGVHS